MTSKSRTELHHQLRTRAEKEGQGHIFKWWDRLKDNEKDILLEQAGDIDFTWLGAQIKKGLSAASEQSLSGRLEPCQIVRLPATEAQKERDEEMRRTGEDALRRGLVAPVMVAGGQGSRLGFEAPKGAYPIGPATQKTLFQFHAEKIRGTWEKYGHATRWYIMTSLTNDRDTREFFEKHNYFGIESDRVRFFTQRMVPSVGLDGKIIMASAFTVFRNPNGSGGVYPALYESGSLDEMASEGVQAMFYFQVDNLIVKVCDPTFVGYHFKTDSEMSLKIIPKRDGDEPLGVTVRLDGKTTVVEYIDLPAADKHAKDENGNLKYWAGSIAIHIIGVDFGRRQCENGFRLPYHRAVKSIPRLDDEGKPVNDPAHKGVKFETFVFDALSDAQNPLIIETKRAIDFSPIKNPRGEDSPESAHRMADELWRSWFKAAGLEPPKGTFELSPLFAQEERDFVERVRAGEDPTPFISE